MFSKIVLCAFPNRLTAGYWRMGRLVTCEIFQNHEHGLNAFRQFLVKYPSTPVYLISDAVEEDYRVESMPHTTGNARKTLLDRKLGQLYRTTSYRAAQFIGREREQRKDDIFLLVSLSNAESIQPWMLVMDELETPLAGVYLLPMVSQFLINRLKLNAPHLLLAEWLVSGLRQTYFQNGKLRVSRLAPDQGVSDQYRNAVYLSETEKTRLYLLSQRLIAPDTRLSLLVLADGHTSDDVCVKISNSLDIECMALDSKMLAKRIGLNDALLHQFPELLYMQTVAKGGVPVNIAPEEQTQHFKVHQFRDWVGYATGAVLVAGLVFSLLNIVDFVNYREQHQQASTQTRDFEQSYAIVSRDFPATPLPGNDLKIVFDISQAIQTNSRTPQRLMQVVATALDASPEIVLQRMRWKSTEDLNVKDDGVANAPAGAAAPSNAQNGGKLREVGFVDGEIRNFTGDYRAALDSVNRLVELIQKDERVESITVVQQPVNVSAQSSLQGSTLDAQAQQLPAATFKLKLILKPVVTP